MQLVCALNENYLVQIISSSPEKRGKKLEFQSARAYDRTEIFFSPLPPSFLSSFPLLLSSPSPLPPFDNI